MIPRSCLRACCSTRLPLSLSCVDLWRCCTTKRQWVRRLDGGSGAQPSRVDLTAACVVACACPSAVRGLGGEEIERRLRRLCVERESRAEQSRARQKERLRHSRPSRRFSPVPRRRKPLHPSLHSSQLQSARWRTSAPRSLWDFPTRIASGRRCRQRRLQNGT